MNIRTFAVRVYKGHNIYIRNWLDHFEYITINRGEIYTTHLTVTPVLFKRVLYFLGFRKSPYSDEQLKKICEEMENIAHVTIDSFYSKK